MDAEVARMMADLGVQRRDHVSAPAEGDRGPRLAHQQETAILADTERRRAQAQQARDDDPRSIVISKWNTPASFGADNIAEALENRYSGQGHRLALQTRIRSGNHDHDHEPQAFGGRGGRDAPRGRRGAELGDERRLYLEERHGPNYTFASPSANTARQRASSPRSAGTVKWINGKRVELQPGGRKVACSKPLPPNTALHDALAKMKAVCPLSTNAIAAKRPDQLAQPSVSNPLPSLVRAKSPEPVIHPPPRTQAVKRDKSIDTNAVTFPSPAVTSGPLKKAAPLPRPTAFEEHSALLSSKVNVISLATPRLAVTGHSARIDNTQSSGPSSTLAPASSTTSGGKLTATYHCANGDYAGFTTYKVDAPVDATITITSKSACFNPLELADAMMNLSRAMRDRSYGMPGFVLAVDGVWEEVDQ